MKVHELKVWPEYFDAILDGSKKFEIRKNDRGFEVGDRLLLQEYCPHDKEYTGAHVFAEVTYMTDFMQAQFYIVMGIKILGKKRG